MAHAEQEPTSLTNERQNVFDILSPAAKEVLFTTMYSALEERTTEQQSLGLWSLSLDIDQDTATTNELRSHFVNVIAPALGRELSPYQLIGIGYVEKMSPEQAQEVINELEEPFIQGGLESGSEYVLYHSGSGRIAERYQYFTSLRAKQQEK